MPLRTRLPGSRSSSLSLRLLELCALPILGAAEQLLDLRSLVPNNRYRLGFVVFLLCSTCFGFVLRLEEDEMRVSRTTIKG